MHFKQHSADRNHQYGQIDKELHFWTRDGISRVETQRPRCQAGSAQVPAAYWNYRQVISCKACAAPRSACKCNPKRGTNDRRRCRHRRYNAPRVEALRLAPLADFAPQPLQAHLGLRERQGWAGRLVLLLPLLVQQMKRGLAPQRVHAILPRCPPSATSERTANRAPAIHCQG